MVLVTGKLLKLFSRHFWPRQNQNTFLTATAFIIFLKSLSSCVKTSRSRRNLGENMHVASTEWEELWTRLSISRRWNDVFDPRNFAILTQEMWLFKRIMINFFLFHSVHSKLRFHHTLWYRFWAILFSVFRRKWHKKKGRMYRWRQIFGGEQIRNETEEKYFSEEVYTNLEVEW